MAVLKISGGKLQVFVSEQGAELQSIRYAGREYLWSGDAAYWTGRAPIMFPICGGLKEDRYELDGKLYTLTKHGFAKLLPFTVEAQSDSRLVLALYPNATTQAAYPYDFVFRVTYAIEDEALQISYTAENRGTTPMYCSIGAHEAYATPEGIEEYDVVFPQKETLIAYDLDGNLLKHTGKQILTDSDRLSLKTEYFAVDALVFQDLKSRKATLVHRKTGRAISTTFPDSEYFLLWTKPGAGYICMEPWCGIQDPVDSKQKLAEKPGIRTVAPGASYTMHHTIQIEKE